MKIEASLSMITLVGAQRGRNFCAVKVAMRYVREKIMFRHDRLRSPTHCFEPKPEPMYGFAGVCRLSD